MTSILTKTFAAVALSAVVLPGAVAATITISCGSNAADIEYCEPFAKEWAAKNGHEIKLFTPPTSTTDYLALLRQQFAAKASDIDVKPVLQVMRDPGPLTVRMGEVSATLSDQGRAQAVAKFVDNCKLD